MTAVTATEPQVNDRLARRNVLILAAANAVGGSAGPLAFIVGGLTGDYLLGLTGGERSLATVPISSFVVGGALMTIPASLLMNRIGRRPGYVLASMLTLLSGLAAAAAIQAGSFVGFCLAMMGIGMANSFVQTYRFAAADTASAGFRPKAISWVMAGGLASGVIGAQAIIWTRDLFAPIPFAGAFLGLAGLALVNIAILTQLRIPKLPAAVVERKGRPLGEIMATRGFAVAAICGIGSFSLMTFVMTASPLAMIACGLTQNDAALGIQWHVLAMYGPSFFTGHLIAKFGKGTIVAVGLAILASCGVVALMGLDVWHFWIALSLLGVGWNFGYVGATAMLTETYRPEERAKVQAANEFLISAVVAMASFSSGKFMSVAGWAAINMMIFPVVGVCLLVLAWHAAMGRASVVAR